MADDVAVQWIYPPDMQDGGWDEKSGNRRVVVRLTGTSDGTGEADVVKVDLELLKTPSGKVPTRTAVEWIQWNVFGVGITLEWDRTPHAKIISINDQGYNNGLTDSDAVSWERFGGFLDPGTDDGTGNIILTTIDAYSGDHYDITLGLRLKD